MPSFVWLAPKIYISNMLRRLNNQSIKTIEPTRNQVRYVTAELHGAASYMIGLGHCIEGTCDEEKIRAAFRSIVERHEVLRTGFSLRNGVVSGNVYAEAKFRFLTTTLDGSFEDFRVWAVPHVFQDVDVSDPGSMVRLLVAIGKERWRFSVAMHHAISDGFSRGKVNEELLKTLAGETLEQVGSYYDFNKPQKAPTDACTLLEDFPIPSRMPEDGSVSVDDCSQLGHFVEREFSIGSADLKDLAKSTGSSKFSVLAATYGLGLAAFTGETRVSSFFQTDGRRVLEAPLDVVGPFSNTLPVNLSHTPEEPFSSFATEVNHRFKAIVSNEAAPLMETLQETGRAPYVSINKFPSARPMQAGDLKIGPREFLDRRTEYDLNLVLTEEGDSVVARAFYDADHVSERRMLAFLDLQEQLLQAAAKDPEASCGSILSQAREGRRSVIQQSNTDWHGADRLHEVFLSTAERLPQAICIQTSNQKLTYDNVRDRAAAFANGLRNEGVGPGQVVGLYAQRHPDLVAAMLGVSIVGAAFAVIDAELPDERISEMLETLGTRTVITAGDVWPDRLGQVKIIKPDASCQVPDCALPASQSGEMAYTLFTSGTTGRPNPVSHPARTLLRFVIWQAAEIEVAYPVTMMLAGLSHDPIMRDIFLPIVQGGAIAIPDKDELKNPDDLNRLATIAQVNVLHATPAAARLLSMAGSKNGFRGCRAIFWGGDTVQPSLVADWRKIAPMAEQWNLYGSTETPQAALITLLDPGIENNRRIPIGNPLPWTGLRIIDSTGESVAAGEIGEIVIDLADQVIGAKRADPKNGFSHRTGDLGVWLPGVGVQFAGRSDRQVKINGHRIELAEIAEIANGVDGVLAAECILVDNGTPLLHLFLVSENERCEPAVRSALARHLPEFMWPSKILNIGAMPLSPNGKVDIPKLELMAADAIETQASPGTEIEFSSDKERSLASIYARVTGADVAHAGVTLADLGADSLAVIEVRMELERLGVTLPAGWEWVTLQELSRLWDGPAEKSKRKPWTMIQLDTFVLVRTLAIILIVQHHFFQTNFTGNSTLLVAFAGFTFGLLHLPAILTDGQTGRVLALLAKIFIPLVPASIAIYAVHSFLGRNVNPSALFLYENFVTFLNIVADRDQSEQFNIHWLWFIHVYIQIFLAIGILLSFERVRQRMKADLWGSLLGAFVLSETVAAATILGVGMFLSDYQGAQIAVSKWPTTLFPLIVLGALSAHSETKKQRTMLFACLVVHVVIVEMLLGGDEYLWLIGLPLAVLIPRVKLPYVLTAALVLMSANALMIYLSHKPFLFIFQMVFENTPVFLSISGALCFGVLCGICMRPILDAIGVKRLARLKISF